VARFVILFVITSVLPACAATPQAPMATSPQVALTHLGATATSQMPPQAQEVVIQGGEGLQVHGTWRGASSAGSPAALLLPM
jgi:hypothetical protein